MVKRHKKIFRIGLLAGLLAALMCVSAGALTSGDWEYSLQGNEAQITGYNGPGGDVVVPATLGGAPVTKIGQKSMRMNDSIRSVTLPSTIKVIGDEAFYDTPLRSINLPEGLVEIRYEAFMRSGLTSVTIPDSVTTLSIGVFAECEDLTSVHLSSSLKIIPKDCFKNCTSLRAVEIPQGVTLINTNGFRNTALTQIALPSSMEDLGNFAFADCRNLWSVTLSYGLKYISNFAFDNCTALTSIYLPTTLKEIGEGAFDNTGITSLILPYGLEKTWGVRSNSIQEISVPSTAVFNSARTLDSCMVYCTAGSDAEKSCQTHNVSYKIDPSVDSRIQVVYQGKRISFGKYGQNPILQSGNTLVPLRSIFETMGATVDWDGATQTVTSTRGGTTVKLTIGQRTLYRNGTAVTLEVPAQLINDTTMVPVRAVAESFNATVGWVQAAQTVTIDE